MRTNTDNRPCTPRSGLTSRHTGPSSSDSSGTPIQSRTKTEPAVGFSASSRPKTAAIATYAVASHTEHAQPDPDRPGVEHPLHAAGSGQPASRGRSRGSRHSRPRARNDTTSATAAPVRA